MLGTAVRKALAARSQPVLQLVRREPKDSSEIQWNPTTTPPLLHSEALENLGAAIHLGGANLAAHRWTAAYKREMIASRVKSTCVLATALAALRHPPKVLLVASATGFYGNRGDEFLDELSLPGSGFLADLCRQWEAAARPAVDAGIRVVHLRSGVIVTPLARPGQGANQGALARMVPIFRLGLGGPLGSGRQWMSWISLADAVAAILFCLDSPALSGPVNLTAPHSVTNADFTRILALQLGRRAILPAPAFALRLFLGQMADEALLASARVMPSRLTMAGFQFKHPTVAQALAAE
jgi:uncharacterized protein (TIGR01777 family)